MLVRSTVSASSTPNPASSKPVARVCALKKEATLDSHDASMLRFAASPASTHSPRRSEEHTSELQSLMRISYAVFCLKKTNIKHTYTQSVQIHTQCRIRAYTLYIT